MTFSFIQNPTGQAMTDSDLVTSALDQPMSLGSTFWDQAKGGILESFGLGTAIRESQLPAEAPTTPELMMTPTDGGAPVRVPDTPQMRRRITAFESVNPQSLQSRQESPQELQQRQNDAGALSEDAYKASPSFRKDIPWQNGMTADRAAALAEQDDTRKIREFYGQKRPVTAFFGNLAGQAVDPINYIPVAGEAVAAANVARFGRIAGRALTSSLDAAANTALASVATIEPRGQLGDDVSWQSTVSQIAMAAMIGGAFGAVHGRFGRATPDELRAEAAAKLATLDNVQASRVSLNDALDGMIRDSEVNLSPASSEFVARAAEQELPKVAISAPRSPEELRATRAKLETDYQFSPDAFLSPDPYGGFREVMKDLPDSVNEQFQAHGMLASSDGSIAEKRLIDLINNGLDQDRTINSGSPRGGVLGVDSTRTEAPYLLLSDPGKTLPETGVKNVVVQGPAEANLAALRQDYPQVNFMTPTEARAFMETGRRPAVAALSPSAPRPSVDSAAPVEPVSPSVVDAAKRVGKPEGTKALAEQYRVNPETGDFPELADIEQLRTEGRLTEEDLAALDDADEIIKTANAYGEALKSFASCTI